MIETSTIGNIGGNLGDSTNACKRLSFVSSINKKSVVTLRQINKENWRSIIELTVLENQKGNVASNVMSLCESQYAEDSWVRAVYADETPVGFLMMSIWEPEEWYAIWRFMIDHKFQGFGFGTKAISLAVDYIRENYTQAKMIRLMVAKEQKNVDEVKDLPYKFYVNLGWKDISDINEEGEIEMGLYI